MKINVRKNGDINTRTKPETKDIIEKFESKYKRIHGIKTLRAQCIRIKKEGLIHVVDIDHIRVYNEWEEQLDLIDCVLKSTAYLCNYLELAAEEYSSKVPNFEIW